MTRMSSSSYDKKREAEVIQKTIAEIEQTMQTWKDFKDDFKMLVRERDLLIEDLEYARSRIAELEKLLLK